MQHAYGQQFWGVPGGVVEVGETPVQAAERETLEEVGANVKITGLIGMYLLQGGGWPDILAFVFSGEVMSEPHIVNPNEIAHMAWINPGDYPEPILPDIKAALEDLKARRTGVVRNVQRKIRMAPLTLS